MSALISVNIVTMNGRKFLPSLLCSLQNQTFQEFAVRVFDNGSTDGTVEYLETKHPWVMLLRQPRNLGFSVGHNRLIRYARDKWEGEDFNEKYILVLNQDTVLKPDALFNLIEEARKHSGAAAFSPKILRASLNFEDGAATFVPSEEIDSTGLERGKGYDFHDRGEGESDSSKYDLAREIFGVSGAAAFYRLAALEAVRFEDEYFDSDFFAYREDVDLAWRFHNRGHKSFYAPNAVIYHCRSMRGLKKPNIWQEIQNRRKKPRFFAGLATRNQWLMIIKNEKFGIQFVNLPRLLAREIPKLVYIAIFETKNLWVLPSFFRLAPRMIRKRKLHSR